MFMRDPRGNTLKLQGASFGYMKDKDCFVVTMVTLTERYMKNEPAFIRIGQSFRLIP
jgi:hypothetical protein